MALVPFLLKGVATDEGLMQADGIHPNAAAQPVLLDTIWPPLKRLLEAPAPEAEEGGAAAAQSQ